MLNKLRVLILAVMMMLALMASCSGQAQEENIPQTGTDNTTVIDNSGSASKPADNNLPAAGADVVSLLKTEDYDQAVAEAKAAASANPVDNSLKEKLADAYAARAWFYKSKRLTTYARDDLRVALEIAPDYYKSNYEYGRFSNNQWQYEIGIYYLDKAIKLKADYAPAYSERAFSYYKRKVYDQALADVEHAIELQSDQAPFYYNRSLIYRALGNNVEAVKDLQSTLKYSTDSALTAKAEKDLQSLQSPAGK